MPLLTHIAFRSKPTPSQHDLIVQALEGWGDPEQLTDTEAVEVKKLCAKWFGLKKTTAVLLQARMWKDAIVFSSIAHPGVEHAIIIQDSHPPANEDIIFLYRVNRGHRLIPAEHCTLQYLKHIVDVGVDVE
jgi:hypothetical protein